ncbi:HNH endonuclease signature motif containing protein [Nocardioides luteus]|uniref:HNH endonuclease signature motif containing protein n=1 Tax=Nocardioides luteus TaxID=1844 RepID=UPI0018CAA952|nr:HNH endonuclease signature motif containing protein [Nocardioides luteus]MBG6096470.1 proteasome lid subunit RPN8/RPN11 [Nocardioides luteus]
MTTLQQPQHPVLEAVVGITAALDQVAEATPAFMGTDQKATTLVQIARAKAQLAELELRVLATADDVAAESAARDVAAWLHHHTHQRPEALRADLRLATALDRSYGLVAAAMRSGRCNPAQAAVIVAALDELPADLDVEIKTKAEETLLAYATQFDPTQLRRLGRRILEVIAPEIAEAEEARRLAAEDAHARKKTRLSMRRLGDGTTRIAAVVPDAAADRLATNLEAFASPRREDGTRTETGDYLPYARRLGLAFCQLLETLDPARLPIHGGDATTVIVTIDLDQLRTEAGIAQVLGGSPITAAEARRLACTAGIIPAVLGSNSEVLDLGRKERLFTAAQRRALLLRSATCEAEGCDIPGTWAEAHHWIEWAQGGATDLSNVALLCSHHHHRAHDPTYLHERLPNGDIRFTRRT